MTEEEYEIQMQERVMQEQAYWASQWGRQQEMEEYPLFFWREMCMPILNIKTEELTKPT